MVSNEKDGDLGKYIVDSRILPSQTQKKGKGKGKTKTTIKINRKGSIVKERCKQLTEIALNLFPNRIISNEDLAFLITSYIGGNRGTVRAYMGYHGFVKHSRIGQLSRIIGKSHRGYLEIFGFMHHKGLKWIIHAQQKLVSPQLPPSLIDECVDEKKSKEKISLSQNVVANPLADREGDVVRDTITNKIINNNNTERERNFTFDLYTKSYTSKYNLLRKQN